MAQLINEAQRFQKLAKIVNESQLNEGGYKFNDANEDLAKEIETAIKPAIEGPLKKAMIDVATKNPKLSGAAEFGLAIGLIAHQIVMDSIKENLNEAEEIKVGGTYVYEHPKAGPVKVKALGKSSYGDEYFTVEALEEKGEVKKGNQYNAEIKALSAAQQAESIESTVNEALRKFRKGK